MMSVEPKRKTCQRGILDMVVDAESGTMDTVYVED